MKSRGLRGKEDKQEGKDGEQKVRGSGRGVRIQWKEGGGGARWPNRQGSTALGGSLSKGRDGKGHERRIFGLQAHVGLGMGRFLIEKIIRFPGRLLDTLRMTLHMG